MFFHLEISNTVVHMKDPLDPVEKYGMIYECKCEECGEFYVGETDRSLGERTQGHDKSVKEGHSKSALSHHLWTQDSEQTYDRRNKGDR